MIQGDWAYIKYVMENIWGITERTGWVKSQRIMKSPQVYPPFPPTPPPYIPPPQYNPPAESVYGTSIVSNPVPSDRLNLRRDRRIRAQSLGKYYNGVVVQNHTDPSNEWVEVSIGNRHGYMQNKYLIYGPNKPAVASACPQMVVSNMKPSSWLNLRESPSTGARVLSTHRLGTHVTVLGDIEGGWCHVLVNGVLGFMQVKYLAPARVAYPY